MIKLIKNGQVITDDQFRDLYPNVSFPIPIPFADYGYEVVFPKPAPSYNKITQRVAQVTPVLNQLGKYEEAWEIIGLTPVEVAANTTANNQKITEATAANIGRLWQAAHDYEFARINGMAIGVLTVGVISNKPKSLAIKAWSQSIWNLYYTRKPTVTEVMDSTLLDFTSIGEMPHSAPELTQEVFP
jgi:hypothetical protein